MYSRAVIISAMPALSSAPRSVVPSVTTRVSPLYFSRSGKTAGERTTPFSSFRTMWPPS